MPQSYGPQPSKKIKRANRKTKRKEWVSKVKSKIEQGVSRRRLKRLAKKGKVSSVGGRTGVAKSSAYSKKTQKSQEKVMPGVTKTGKVSRGATGAVRTKGGTYAKYKKDSKAAGSFRSKFKSSCGGGAKSFSWQGRSYACKTKASPKKKVASVGSYKSPSTRNA